MRWFVIAVAIALGSAARASAVQELSDRQLEFLKEFNNLLELQNSRGINQLLTRDAAKDRIAPAILDLWSHKFASSGDPKVLETAAPLAGKVDEYENGKRLQTRMELLKTMTPDQRAKWRDLATANSTALNNFVAAHQSKEAAGYKKVAAELQDIADQAKKINDSETESFALYHVGICFEETGDSAGVYNAFNRGMDAWLAGGRAKDAFYEHMKEKRASTLEKLGKEPDPSDAATPAGEKKNSTTSYKEGVDWMEWTTEYREMKDPLVPASTSPFGCEHVLLWREFNWADKTLNPLGHLVQAAPFGKPLHIGRDGSKGWFDVDNDQKQGKHESTCKVIASKATLNPVKSGEGKDADSYAFFLLTGGEQEMWFGMSVNYAQSGRYRVGCYREGKILGETVLLLDDNATGVIGDPSELMDNRLRGGPKYTDNDGLQIGKAKPIPWSDVVEIGGKWHHLKVSDTLGKRLRTRELDIQTGTVQLTWNGPVRPKMLVLGEVRDFKGSFFDVAGGDKGVPVAVPAGRYEIAYGRIETGKAAQMKQAWIFRGDSKEIEVKPGEAVTLDMGGPYTFDLEADDSGKTLKVKGKSMLVREKSGAIVGRFYDEIPLPDVAARVKGGSPLGKPTPMKRISTDYFSKDNDAVWFPADLVLEKSEKQKVELQFTMKKPHTMLGGPFSSDWK